MEGLPAKLHVSSPVADVDPIKGTITLKDGTTVEGDVVIGADGVHSVTRTKVPGANVKPFSAGKSVFRFMIPRETAEKDPKTSELIKETGTCLTANKGNRKIVMYPTTHNQLLNFGCFHPESESEASDDWNTHGKKEKLLELFEDWGESFRALLQLVDSNSLHIYRLWDMMEIPNWAEGRLALLGDAAHPFLPFLGSGGATAIEDAAALGVVLEAGLTREEVPARLKLYEDIRHDRAHFIQAASRTNVAETDKGRESPPQKNLRCGTDNNSEFLHQLYLWT